MVNLSTTARFICFVNRISMEGESKHIDNIESLRLVPGDLIQITDQLTLPCDCVLLQVWTVIL